MAEGQRFELWNQLSPVTPLAGERLRPLGQPSVFHKINNDKTQALYTPEKNILQEYFPQKNREADTGKSEKINTELSALTRGLSTFCIFHCFLIAPRTTEKGHEALYISSLLTIKNP